MFYVANVSFKAIPENKILKKISEYRVTQKMFGNEASCYNKFMGRDPLNFNAQGKTYDPNNKVKCFTHSKQ